MYNVKFLSYNKSVLFWRKKMSNPDTPAALDLSSLDTFESKVNAVVNTFKVDDSGNTQLPEGLNVPDDVLYAAKLEKRRRDTESTLGKTKAQLKAEQAKVQTLQTKVALRVEDNLTQEQRDVLEHLQNTDLNAWRQKMNELEATAREQLQTELKTNAEASSQQVEMERRGVVLAEFNHQHADMPITNEVIENDIPPRIINKLNSGKITFEEFLAESYDFLTKPRTIGSQKPPVNTNISKAGGGVNPAAEAVEQDFSATYKSTVF